MSRLRAVGPGIVIAATGLGAGDLIAASVAGARYGTALLWVVAVGALLKFGLNEGLARWQLATGSTLIEALIQRLSRFWSVYFLIYLFVWSFIVAGALMAACGLAVHAMFPGVSVKLAGVFQSLLAAAMVLFGRYQVIELIMKVFISLMFVVVMVCAFLLSPNWQLVLQGFFIPVVPEQSTWFLLGVLGGIGGSVTLLSYGYWMREKGWRDKASLPQMRTDLAVAYTLTGLFGVAIMLIASAVPVEAMSGNQMVLAVAEAVGEKIGPLGQWCFLIGFWGAVFSSMLGVWQGIPYLFADFVNEYWQSANRQSVTTAAPLYRGYLAYLCLLPMALLWLDKPVWLVLLYSVTGAAFMPFLAAVILFLNNRVAWIGTLRNGVASNMLLVSGLAVFFTLLINKIMATI